MVPESLRLAQVPTEPPPHLIFEMRKDAKSASKSAKGASTTPLSPELEEDILQLEKEARLPRPVSKGGDPLFVDLHKERMSDRWLWGSLAALLALVWCLSTGKIPWIYQQQPMEVAKTITYEAVTGFFVQDTVSADSLLKDPVPQRFGLIDDEGNYWKNFKREIKRLNFVGRQETVYKVIFLSRHGEGFHNVAEAKYGTKAWDDHWALLNGDGKMVWGPDAKLSEVGIGQAKKVNSIWQTELTVGGGIPVPTKLYSSPLNRAATTLQISYDGITSVTPLIMESLREVIGLHTCDKRSTRTQIHEAFPKFDIEKGFTEDDELWRPDEREPREPMDLRIKSALDRIFQTEDTFIGIVAHGGVIQSTLRIIGHQPYDVSTGGVIPLIIKATFT